MEEEALKLAWDNSSLPPSGEDDSEAEETFEEPPGVMAQLGHFAQGCMVHCTLLDHLTLHYLEQAGASEEAPNRMTQLGHFAKMQCTLLDHPTPYQKYHLGAT